jgi:inner membrane protein
MDSVSHIVIGAAIGEVVVGKKIGRWALLVGAIAKSFPDFDLLYTGLNDPRAYMCDHRGHTHSLVWQPLYALPLAYFCYFVFRKKVSVTRFYILILACLWGHSLLDWCTNFGTQLLLPFTNKGYSLNNLAIVDLLFTLPMLLLILVAVFIRKNSEVRNKLAKVCLVYCSIYLGLTFVNKAQANTIAAASIAKNNIPATAHLTNPTILNNVLWYALASNDSTVYVGEFSLLHKNNPITWHSYARNQYLLDSSKSIDDVKRIRWFGNPYTIAQKNGDTLDVYAVKFGRTNMLETELQKSFIFHYTLFPSNNVWQMGMVEPNQDNANFKDGFVDLWERINGRRF